MNNRVSQKTSYVLQEAIMKKLFVVSVISILVLSFSVVALAASKPQPPAPSGNVIYACFQKINGQLRIISSTGKCRPSEMPITWNITGPQGTPGVANGISTAVHGLIEADGSASGSGFTVAHVVDPSPGNGLYDITFTTPFTSAPDCLITPLNSDPVPACLPDEPTTTNVTVHCTSAGAAADAAFEFLCVQ